MATRIFGTKWRFSALGIMRPDASHVILARPDLQISKQKLKTGHLARRAFETGPVAGGRRYRLSLPRQARLSLTLDLGDLLQGRPECGALTTSESFIRTLGGSTGQPVVVAGLAADSLNVQLKCELLTCCYNNK